MIFLKNNFKHNSLLFKSPIKGDAYGDALMSSLMLIPTLLPLIANLETISV